MNLKKLAFRIGVALAAAGAGLGIWNHFNGPAQEEKDSKSWVRIDDPKNSCESCERVTFKDQSVFQTFKEGDYHLEISPPLNEEMEVKVYGVDGKLLASLLTQATQHIGFVDIVGGPQREIIFAGTGGTRLPEDSAIKDVYEVYQVLPEGVQKIVSLVTRQEAGDVSKPFTAKVKARRVDGVPVLEYQTSLGNVALTWNGKRFVDLSGKLRNLEIPQNE